MGRKKAKKHPQIADQTALRTIFARLADGALSIKFKLGSGLVRSRVIDEVDGTIFTGFRLEDIERYAIKTNTTVNIVFYHEGKEYYGGMRVLGAGRYDQQEALRLKIPDVLHIKDDFGLTTYNVSPRIEVTFTDMFKGYRIGSMVNLGVDGVDIINKESTPTKELLAVDRQCDIAFDLDSFKIYCKGNVLYINNVGEELIGIEFDNPDKKVKADIEQWIQDKTAEKAARDKSWLQRHVSGDLKRAKNKKAQGDIDKTAKPPRLIDDYKTVLHEPSGAETVLLLCRDTNMVKRIAKALKRKYGVLISKGRFTNVRAILEYYKPDLVFVYSTLGTISGFDLVGTIRDQLESSPPIIIVGEEDGTASRPLAVKKGAAYWTIEPFRPLSFFKRVEEIFDVVRRANAARAAQAAKAQEAIGEGDSVAQQEDTAAAQAATDAAQAEAQKADPNEESPKDESQVEA